MNNRRRFTRVRASLRFTLAWGDSFELFRTVDLSASGASLVCHVANSAMPPLHTAGQCAFNIDSVEVRVTAQVVRTWAGGYAVNFVGLSSALEDRIVAWVFRMQAQTRPRRF
jgi:c-di-GMP-binding flagellar brake protein YcgR